MIGVVNVIGDEHKYLLRIVHNAPVSEFPKASQIRSEIFSQILVCAESTEK